MFMVSDQETKIKFHELLGEAQPAWPLVSTYTVVLLSYFFFDSVTRLTNELEYFKNSLSDLDILIDSSLTTGFLNLISNSWY